MKSCVCFNKFLALLGFVAPDKLKPGILACIYGDLSAHNRHNGAGPGHVTYPPLNLRPGTL